MSEATPPQNDMARTLTVAAVSVTPWYAVIDAARDATAPQRATEAGLEVQSLYEGPLGQELAGVAPHLMSFDLHNEFAEWLFDRWAGHHGILLQTKAPFEELRRHFRKFLLVKDEAEKKFRFRFYDPRVLRSFLPACSFDEAKEFFGPVQCYYAASRDGVAVLALGWGTKGLTMKELFPAEVPSRGQE